MKRYILKKIFVQLAFLLLAFSSNVLLGQTDWYSYRTGDWDHPDTWTTDPGGTTLVGTYVPQNGDSYTILTGRIVTLTGDVIQEDLVVTINNGGTLNMWVKEDETITSYIFTEGLALLAGKGTVKVTTTVPSATTNTFVNVGGGTTEFNHNDDFTIPATTYNNLTLNLDDAAHIATMLGNITLNGNLTITQGVFRINDDIETTPLELIVNGNVSVASGSSLIVGEGNVATTTSPLGISGGTAPFVNYYSAHAHTVQVYGNFTNNGTVRFTNQEYPTFHQFPTNGFASVFFRGTSNNSLVCNGATDFYNLIVDKGTDQTYEFSVNSSNYQNFRLFGANIATAEANSNNPIVKKALWLRNGTLRLYGKVVIPSLSEGSDDAGDPNSDFYIPANGAFIIEGPDVIVLATADDFREVNTAYGIAGPSNAAMGVNTSGSGSSFSILGKFQINNGYISTRESSGFIYWGTSAGQFIVNGGTIDAKQHRTAGTSGGLMAYRQTGGKVLLRGRLKHDVTGVSIISDLKKEEPSSNRNSDALQETIATYNIDRDDNIFYMSGGTITIFDVCGDADGLKAFEVNSLPSNINVTGGNIIIDPKDADGTDRPFRVVSSAPIYNLTIDGTNASPEQTVELIGIEAKDGVTARPNQPLAVLNNLIISNGATFIANDLEVKIGGNFTIDNDATYTPGYNRTTFNGTANQTFTGDGTIDGNFNVFKVDKPSGTITLAGDPVSYTVRDSLMIIQGTLDDNGKTLNVAGHIYVGGTHTGDGKIVLNGTLTQTIEADVFGTPSLGNLELQNTTNPGAQLQTDLTVETLTLNANTGQYSIFDIAEYRLTLNEGVVTSLGSLAFGDDKKILTSGNVSDRGLTYSISNSGEYYFPLGVVDYTPVTLNLSQAPSSTFQLTIVPVNSYHPSTMSGFDNSKVLQFYWKTLVVGTHGLTPNRVSFVFTKNGTFANQAKDALWLDYDLPEIDWQVNSNGANNPPNIYFPTETSGLINGDYTAGLKGQFNKPRTLYSIQNGDWHLRATWSETGHTGSSLTGQVPQSYDRMIIGGAVDLNHQITMTADLTSTAGVIIRSSDFTGISGTPPTLIKPAGATAYNLTSVSGGGRYQQFDNNLPTGDFEDFCNNQTAIFEYAGGTYTIPEEIKSYPNLHITSNAADITKTLPDINLLVRGNLRMNSGNMGSVLSINSSANSRTLTVYGDLEFANECELLVPVATGQKTINIYGDIDFTYNSTSDANSITVASGAGNTHKLNFYGENIISGSSQLAFHNAVDDNQMDIYLLGSGNVNISTGTTSHSLNRLIVTKSSKDDLIEFQNNLTLGAATNTSPKALELNVGTLSLEGATTNIELTSGGPEFEISQDAALLLKNGASVYVIGNNTGIFLDGLLSAEGASEINLGDGSTADNRYIEYSGSGNAAIALSGDAKLYVNSQIRRPLAQTNGILLYTQSGNSEAIIYGQGANLTRAKLEVVNDDSYFSMTDNTTLTIVRGSGTTFGDLLIRPASGSVTGEATINIGNTAVGGESFSFDANIPLNHLNIVSPAAANTALIMVNPLQFNGDLNISTNSTLNANGIDVTLKGDFTNNGIYDWGTGNTTTFNGVTQTIDGTTATDFYNLRVNPSTSLTLIRNQIVNNNLEILSGNLSAGIYDIEVKGDLTNNAIHSSTDGRLILNGINGLQSIFGNGTFSYLELDNADGARLNNHITLSKDFYLTNGIFNINQYLLTLGAESNIVGAPFSASKMITSDGVVSNVGIRKYFNAISEKTIFTYPLGLTGSPNKYTPIVIEILATDAGLIRINNIDGHHPATYEPRRVLNYYWDLENTVSNFTGDIKFYYNQSDVRLDVDDEYYYVAARVIVGAGDSWSKAATGPGTDNVDEDTNQILFQFTTANDLAGEYTAGRDEDIPDLIPIFYSKLAEGDWDDIDHWDPQAPAGGPNGFRIYIPAGSTVRTKDNRRFAYRSTINGRLEVAETYGHNLGVVSGTGTLSLEDQTLPAGRFTTFFSCAGGTLEFNGSKDYTIIADRIDTLRNVHFLGTGTRTLPDKDWVICNEFLIDGPTVDNASNKQLTIGGTMVRNSGKFIAGSGSGATVRFKGIAPQTLSGFNEDTESTLFNIEIDNPDGLTLESRIDFDGNLKLNNGVITTTEANILYMRNPNGGTNVDPVGGSATSYVNGPMFRFVFGGNDFIFPVGKGSRYGKLGLIGPSTESWTVEYFNSSFGDLSVIGDLVAVSSTEHWKIIAPTDDASSATVQLRWDELSDINPTSTTDGKDDIVVAEYDGADWIEKTSDAPSGSDSNGTVQTSENITIKNSTNPQFYTLGSKSTVKAMARFASGDDRCQGTPIPITFSGVTADDLPYVISYSIGGDAQTDITIEELPYPGLPTPLSGEYELTGFKYNYVADPESFDTGLVGDNTVFVNPIPTAPTALDVPLCGPGSVTLVASGAVVGEEYKWYTAETGGTLLQTDGDTFTTPYLNTTTTYYVAIYDEVSLCESARTAVQAIIDPKPEFSVSGSTDQGCDDDPFTLTVTFTVPITLPYTIVIYDGVDPTPVVTHFEETDDTGYVYSTNMVWLGSTPNTDYSYTVEVTDDNVCINDPSAPVSLRVWKIPETGPQYHIPNIFGE